MATQTVISTFVASQTSHSFRLRNRLTGAIVDTQAATETTSGSGMYTAVFTDIPSGVYVLQFIRDSDSLVVGDKVVHLALRTGTFSAGIAVGLEDYFGPITVGTVAASPAPATTAWFSDLGDTSDIEDVLVVFKSGALVDKARPAWGVAGGGGHLRTDEAWRPSAPAAGDIFYLYESIHFHSKSEIAATVWTDATRSLTESVDASSLSGTALSQVSAALTAASAVIPEAAGTIEGFPDSLTIGDSYVSALNNFIKVYVRNSVNTPLTGLGSKNFIDADFGADLTVSQGSKASLVNATCTWIPAAGPVEGYLKVEFPSDQTRRATEGSATMQLIFRWDGGIESTIATQPVEWEQRVTRTLQ